MKSNVVISGSDLNLFFAPVRKVKMGEIIPGANFMNYNNHAVIMSIDGVDNFVNFCSPDYGLLPTYDIFPLIENLLSEKFRIEIEYVVRGTACFYAYYKLISTDITVGKEDQIQPTMMIAHSYNSRNLFNVNFGFRRKICENGLWGLVMENGLTISHTNNSVERLAEKVLVLVEDFMARAGEEAEKYDVLYQQKLKVSELESIVKEAINATGFYKSVEKEVIERVMFEKNTYKLPLTNWLLYNAFNYQLNHSDKLNGTPEDKMKKDKAMFAYLHGGMEEEITEE